VDEAYRATSRMFYTVETHLTHQAEARANEPIEVTTQLLAVDDKRLHVFHRLHRASDGQLLATAEQMHLHVVTARQKAAPIDAAVKARLDQLLALHRSLPAPAEAGRRVGLRAG